MENGKSTQSNLKLPNPDKLTLKWMWGNIPVKYWISLLSLLIAFFIAGIYMGQIGWVKDLWFFSRLVDGKRVYV
jgi:hypothetical protein